MNKTCSGRRRRQTFLSTKNNRNELKSTPCNSDCQENGEKGRQEDKKESVKLEL